MKQKLTEIEANASIVKKMSKYFKIELTISMLGKVIVHWVYPPQEEV